MTDKPTAEDMGRSLEADLKLCEAADRAPWRTDDRGRIRSDWSGEPGAVVIGWSIARCSSGPANAAFIAAGRTGWPAAIRLALAYRDALRGLLARIHRDGGHHAASHGDLESARLADGVVCELRAYMEDAVDRFEAVVRQRDAAEAEAARLRAANGKLRQALEEYLSSINEDNAWPCDDDHGGIWIDCQSDRVQELATAAEEALESQP